jgi:hypothetical protein
LVSKILKNIGGKKVSVNRYQNRNRNSVQNFKTVIENYGKTGERKKEFSREFVKEKKKTKIEEKINKQIQKLK